MSRSKYPFPNPFFEWTRLFAQANDLYLTSASVIRMRTLVLMGGGGKAHREAHTMVTEKIDATIEAAMRIPMATPMGLTTTARTALQPYRRRVAANHRRLSGRKETSGQA